MQDRKKKDKVTLIFFYLELMNFDNYIENIFINNSEARFILSILEKNGGGTLPLYIPKIIMHM